MKLIIFLSLIILTKNIGAFELPKEIREDGIKNFTPYFSTKEERFIVYSPKESNEHLILTGMPEDFRWSALIAQHMPLSIDECRMFVYEAGYAVKHSEVRKQAMIFEDCPSFKEWVMNEIAPPLNSIDAQKAFAEEYLKTALEHHLIHFEEEKVVLLTKQLVMSVFQDSGYK